MSKPATKQKLSKRLLAVAEVVKPTDALADVGCDHGKLMLHFLQQKIAKFVVGIDVSEPSAKKAEMLLKQNGYKNFSIVVSNGFEKFDKDSLDIIKTILISGLGGYTIVEVLENLKQQTALTSFKQIVLQPQNNVLLVRNFLRDNNFFIESDKVLEEGGKFYNIISAIPTNKKHKLSKQELVYGKTNLLQKNNDFLMYLNFKYEQLEQIVYHSKNKKPYKKEQKEIEKLVKKLSKLQ